MAAHRVISGTIMIGVALPVAALVLGAAHAWFNSSYTDDYKALLDDIAKESAVTCSLDDQDRKERVYSRIQNDVRDSGGSSIFGIVAAPISVIPFIGNIAPDFEWLPNKKIYDALATAEENDIRFYRGSGFKKGVQAVIFNDGVNAPTMVYRDLDDGQLPAIMDVVRKNNGLEQGALVLSWNDAREEYETTQVGMDAAVVPVMDGISEAPMPQNTCYLDDSLTGRTMEGIKGWIPTFGGKDDEEIVEPEAIIEPDADPETEEKKGPGFFERARGGFGLWDGKNGDGETEPAEPEQLQEENTSAPAPVPAP